MARKGLGFTHVRSRADVYDAVVAKWLAICTRYRAAGAQHAVFFPGGFEKSYRHFHDFVSDALGIELSSENESPYKSSDEMRALPDTSK